MSDRITEITNQSWFGRIKNAVVGVLIGGVLLLVGIGVLFWNEGEAVRTATGLAEGEKVCISVAADSIDPANDGKLIQFSAPTATDQSLSDPQFALHPSESILKLKRTVEMYQWKERKESKTKKKVGGGETTETTYHYDKAWSDRLINSSSFHSPGGHSNPTAMPFPSHTVSASPITAGAFTLSTALVDQIDNFEPLPIPDSTAIEPDPALAGLKVVNGIYYKGADPGTPQIGDVKVHFAVCRPGPVSIIAAQAAGGQLSPFSTRSGFPILDLRIGTFTATEQFAILQRENTIRTWILRLAGFLAITIGLALFLRPLAVLADVVPFIGSLVQGGTVLVAGLLGAALSVGIIGLAWLYYRPVLSIGLFAAAGVAIFGIRHLRKRPQPVRQVAPVPPPIPIR